MGRAAVPSWSEWRTAAAADCLFVFCRGGCYSRTTMLDDAQLLRRYVEERSEEAFTELVRRHVNLVYFAALRRVGGDAHLADDVAQSVFADLARKAPTLQDRAVLAGWLHTSTRFAAAQAVRSEQRRRNHEQEAQTMNELQLTPEPDWNQLGPIIDEALDELADHEREAVLLRFFENRPFAEVGARFALSADATRMRVERALDKLRDLLAKRGIASTSAALAAVFAAQSGFSAPASLVGRIMAGVAGQGGAATVATVALWKILAGVAVGVAAIGLVMVEARSAKSEATANRQGVTHDAGVFAAVETVERSRPELAAAAAGPAEASSVGEISPFDRLSERQKHILKRLWEHRKLFPDAPLSEWTIKPGPLVAVATVTDFNAAADSLRSNELVGIYPGTGAVFLATAGAAFCQAHAREIDAYQITPGPSVPLRFSVLPAAEKEILKTLWEHQKITPDRPPLHWGFKVGPASPGFGAFEAAVAGLREVNGLVSVGAKTGIVYLNDRGLGFCQAHADELDAYPLPARVYRPVPAANRTPSDPR